MDIQNRIDSLKSEFAGLQNWEDKYKKIIEMGRALEPMSNELKSSENIVKGCQAQVWLSASLTESNKMKLFGDSDALIVKGLIAVLLSVYSESTPLEILQKPPDFIKELGFDSNLSPSRANGLFAMIKQIKNYAIAFDYIIKSQV